MKLTSVRALQHVSLSVEGVDVAASMAEVAAPTPDPDILHIPQLSLEVRRSLNFLLVFGRCNTFPTLLNIILFVCRSVRLSVRLSVHLSVFLLYWFTYLYLRF